MIRSTPNSSWSSLPSLLLCHVLPMPLTVAWVNRLTFSPSSPSSSSPSPHHQLFVSLRYRKCHGGGAWVLRCDAILFTLSPGCKSKLPQVVYLVFLGAHFMLQLIPNLNIRNLELNCQCSKIVTKSLYVFLLGTENFVGGWMAIVVVV